MSIRSCIGELLPDGRVRAIYCHGDGGLHRGGVGWMLATFYASAERVASLLDLGDCSRLMPGLGQRHRFDRRMWNWSTFYGRDRGERGRSARVYADLEQFAAERAGYLYVEFLYAWAVGNWRVCEVDLESGLVSQWQSLAARLESVGRRVAGEREPGLDRDAKNS